MKYGTKVQKQELIHAAEGACDFRSPCAADTDLDRRAPAQGAYDFRGRPELITAPGRACDFRAP